MRDAIFEVALRLDGLFFDTLEIEWRYEPEGYITSMFIGISES